MEVTENVKTSSQTWKGFKNSNIKERGDGGYRTPQDEPFAGIRYLWNKTHGQ